MKKKTLTLVTLTSLNILSLLSPAAAQIDCKHKPALQDRFTLNGAVLTQTGTSLEWKRCAEGTTWQQATDSCVGEPLQIAQSEAVDLLAESGGGWRLPAIRELYGLLDSTCADKEELHSLFPDLNQPIFGEYADFWSATNDQKLTSMYYYLDFVTYALDFHSQSYSLAIRAVRDVE